jgi:hypothetical protein
MRESEITNVALIGPGVIGRGVDAMEGKTPLNAICRWRDRLVLRIRALKEKDPHPQNESNPLRFPL